MTNYILTAFIFFITVSGAEAQWQVVTEFDAMTDEEKKSALVVNESGHSFSVYRLGEQVWANFRLSPEDSDILNHDRLPMLRVDQNEPQDLNRFISLQKLVSVSAFYEIEPKWINFKLLAGVIAPPPANVLRQIMDGNTLIVRYYLFTGGYKDTRFQLAGSEGPIILVTGLPHERISEKDAQSRQIREFVDYMLKECKNSGCRAKVTECATAHREDLEAFNDCIY